MDLTDSEKRDIVELIKNNQPLPESYRFRLFRERSRNEIEIFNFCPKPCFETSLKSGAIILLSYPKT